MEDYYPRLFAKLPVDNSEVASFLDHLRNRLSPEQRKSLEKLVSLEEMSSTIKGVATIKIPGDEGLPTEFLS